VYEAREVILLIDTTYFGDWWVMAFKCKEGKQILHHEIVWYETNEWYRRWVRCLEQQWWKIVVIVCDGRRWLLWWFGDTPTQMCHFHQHQIMRRYITKNPKLQANKDLKKIVRWLSRTSRECLEAELERWYKKHEWFLKEQWVNSKWKKYYKHQRTRSGYYSLKRNMKYLFVYLDYLWEIDIPNTTNGIEAVFSHLKPKVWLHRWLKKRRKIKLIKYLLTHGNVRTIV
jgi:hypothetical protein